MTRSGVSIVAYKDLVDRPDLDRELDAIFFEASSVRSFESEKSRSTFRWRWLGRFLEAAPELALLAIEADGRVAGYVIGSLRNPAMPLDAELPFYALFAEQTRAYPAHLHINLAPEYRSRGIGLRLIEAFAANAAAAGAPGVHIVSSRGMRNLSFYAKCGFAERAVIDWNGSELVLMGKLLAPPPA